MTLMDWTEEIRAPWVNLLTGIGMEWRIDYIESPVVEAKDGMESCDVSSAQWVR